MHSFIDDNEIWDCIKRTQRASKSEVRDILDKASERKGINIYDTAALLQVKDPDLIDEIFHLAKQVKEHIYGNRIVIFVPLYISNECSNVCEYCGYRADNTELLRKTLSIDEIKSEIDIIQRQGHKRVLVVYGDNESYGVERVVDCIQAIYSVEAMPPASSIRPPTTDHRPPTYAIRRVNINAAPMSIDDFRILKTSNIGTYQLFQETYHHKTYERVHISGQKSDYMWRLYGLHRAMEAGIDDVAMGVLYGLFDPIFETLAMLQHSLEMERVFGIGPHTISFPRLEPAMGSYMSEHPPYIVDDDLFKKIVAVTRLAVPYTGMILSTRETPNLRNELINLGVSQISAGSKTSPGTYHESSVNIFNAQQFTIGDKRNLDEVIYDLVQTDHIPSFCTACYRLGRHGHNFMDMAKSSHIKSFCQPNALLTFAEYLQDYASEKTKAVGYEMINRLVEKLPNEDVKASTKAEIESIKLGERDIFH